MGIQFQMFQVGQVILCSDLNMMKRSTWNMYFWWTWLNGSASHRWLESSGSSDRFNVRLLSSTFTCDKIYWSVTLRVRVSRSSPERFFQKRKQQRITALTTPRNTQEVEKHRKSHKSERNFGKKKRTGIIWNNPCPLSCLLRECKQPFPPPTPNLLDVPLPWQWSGKRCYSEVKDAIFQRELQISLVMRSKNKQMRSMWLYNYMNL